MYYTGLKSIDIYTLDVPSFEVDVPSFEVEVLADIADCFDFFDDLEAVLLSLGSLTGVS